MAERPVPPESITDRIKRFKKDLKSEIVIQKKEGHWEYPDHGSGHGQIDWDPAAGDSWVDWKSVNAFDEKYKKWVVDQPRIAKPNTEKREAARSELQEIYNSAKTLKVRMQVGRTLGYSRIRIIKERLLG